ncbi:hypothetical protein [Rhodococcus sp. IEGM 1408]|uniref:hypothetical protein n=1 Tax=Rhodococcus sp. IEGM 1408 TaxID=3082220 RepID=UPI002952AFD5|nr:hypothetical protein [Rhodococcus sp. IEGM 1408]MDV8001287.1 hypothetical protein [Rhodococcus sp. IEGM 1408]
MPPIKRTQKPVTPPSRRRLAGHTAPATATPEPASTPAPAPASGPGSASWLDKTRHDDEVIAPGSAADAGGAPGRRRPTGRSLAYAGLAVGLVAGAAGAYLYTEPGVNVDNQAFVDRAATDEVLAAASTNVQRLVAIDHQSLDEYHDSLGEFLTPNLVAELDKNWPALRDSYEQSATTVDARVSEAGLSYLADDRAEVLLVQDVSMMRDGVAAGSTSGTYLVGLDKVDGVWKLSRIPDLPS